MHRLVVRHLVLHVKGTVTWFFLVEPGEVEGGREGGGDMRRIVELSYLLYRSWL